MEKLQEALDLLENWSSLYFEENIQEVKSILKEYIESKNKGYKISFKKVHVKILMRVLEHVSKTWSNEFDIKDFVMPRSSYTNMSQLVNFGLLHRLKDENGVSIKWGHYGINRGRVIDFILWKFEVAKFYNRIDWKNEHSEERISINEVPESSFVLTAENHWLPDFITYYN